MRSQKSLPEVRKCCAVNPQYFIFFSWQDITLEGGALKLPVKGAQAAQVGFHQHYHKI